MHVFHHEMWTLKTLFSMGGKCSNTQTCFSDKCPQTGTTESTSNGEPFGLCMSKIRKNAYPDSAGPSTCFPWTKMKQFFMYSFIAKRTKQNNCLCDPQPLLHATYLQVVSSFCWQAPVTYPRQLWVAQGLEEALENPLVASAASENHTKPHPLLAQFSDGTEDAYESTPHSHRVSTKMGCAFKDSCCWVLVKAGISSKILWCVTFDTLCPRFANTGLDYSTGLTEKNISVLITAVKQIGSHLLLFFVFIFILGAMFLFHFFIIFLIVFLFYPTFVLFLLKIMQ